jgi:hypothetical protein
MFVFIILLFSLQSREFYKELSKTLYQLSMNGVTLGYNCRPMEMLPETPRAQQSQFLVNV